MVKHNNVIPNQHFHKKWSSTSRGPLKVKCYFNQPAQKKVRRLKRAEKAAAIAPRPSDGALRPAVACPTNRYNSKVRLGRGFTLAELKGAGIPKKLASTIGIAVDGRRTNKSQESLDRNIARLKAYKEKLVIFPRKGAKAKGIDAKPADRKAEFATTTLALPAVDDSVATMALTDEVKDFGAYSSQRIARNELRMTGVRLAMKKAKEAAEK